MSSTMYLKEVETEIKDTVNGTFLHMERMFGEEYYTRIFYHLCDILSMKDYEYDIFLDCMLKNKEFKQIDMLYNINYKNFMKNLEFMHQTTPINKYRQIHFYEKMESPIWFGEDKFLIRYYDDRNENIRRVFARDPFGNKINDEEMKRNALVDITDEHPQFFLQSPR